MDRDTVVSLVVGAVNDYLRTSGATAPPGDVSESTRLLGQNGIVDSAGLINVVLEVEARLRDGHGIDVVLADEKAFAQRSSPFLSVSSLADHAHACIEEARSR